MRLALFSDLHGNVTGLRAVLAALEQLGRYDVLVCAGDIVGWPGTADLMDLLASRDVRLVRGNGEDLFLDFEAQTRGKAEEFLAPMRVRDAWLQSRYPEEVRPLLEALPLTLTIEAEPGRRVLVCHSTPTSTTSNATRLTAPPEELRAAYGSVDADVVVHGHAHRHAVRWLPRNAPGDPGDGDSPADPSGGDASAAPAPGRRADSLLLVGVASVGARADGLSAFTTLEFTRGAWAARQFQVPYDVDEEARLCRARRAGHEPVPGVPPRHDVPGGPGTPGGGVSPPMMRPRSAPSRPAAGAPRDLPGAR